MNFRYYSLDYLRGLMALCVMFYHYTTWSNIQISNSTLIAKFGVFAVVIFYILSGLSLSLVYLRQNSFDFRSFYAKRFLRIFPLFFTVVILTVSLQYLNYIFANAVFNFSWVDFVLNITLLFGLTSPSSYIPIGGWSIGNEVFFYLFFPFFVHVFFKRRFFLIFFISVFTISAFIYINFFVCFNNENYWSLYITPLNHLFVFYFGFVIGLLQPIQKFRSLYFLGFSIAFLIFFLYIPGSEKYSMLFGLDRLVLTSVVCFLVLFYYLYNVKLYGYSHKIFNWFGEHCYSIYLIHPLVFFPVQFLCNKIHLPWYVVFIFSVIFTVIVSFISYRFIELPGMIFGKSFSIRQKK